MCTGLAEWRLVGCVVDLYLMPVCCVTGIILNLLCISVFKSLTQHPLVPSLMVLSACDLIQLTMSLFVLFVPALHDFMEAPMLGILGEVAFVSTGLLSPLLMTANCASIWTMCYITVQRYRAIAHPLNQMQNPPRPFAPLLLVLITALCFNGSKWAEYEWYVIHDYEIIDKEIRTEMLSVFIAHKPSALASNVFYRKTFDMVLYPVLVYIIPLFLLIVLNYRILRNISRRRVFFDHKSRMGRERRSVTLIISIVLFFFCCHTGGLAFRWMDLRLYENNDWLVVVKDAINFLFNFNSACNPLLYFFFTRQFRDLRASYWSRHFAVRSGASHTTTSTTSAPQAMIMTSQMADSPRSARTMQPMSACTHHQNRTGTFQIFNTSSVNTTIHFDSLPGHSQLPSLRNQQWDQFGVINRRSTVGRWEPARTRAERVRVQQEEMTHPMRRRNTLE